MAVAGRQQECAGLMGRNRTSKIAGLPAAIREELNERLLDGEKPGRDSLVAEWLAAGAEDFGTMIRRAANHGG